MVKRKDRFPAGSEEITLVFQAGEGPILSVEVQDRIEADLDEIHQIHRYRLRIDLGKIEVRGVPLNEIEVVRAALEGLKVVGGAYTLHEVDE